MQPIETIIYKGYSIEIYQDESADDPRNWGNLATFAAFHRRYKIGDSHRFEDIAALKDYLKRNAAIYLPVYMYDHSGVCLNTTGFSCAWDSGQVGYIYALKEDIKKEFGVKRISRKLKTRVLDILRGEIETYDQYMCGDVYGYRIKNKDGEVVDSCWGFYGDDHEKSDLIHQAKSQINWCVREQIKTHINQVKTWIKNRVPLHYRIPLQIANY